MLLLWQWRKGPSSPVFQGRSEAQCSPENKGVDCPPMEDSPKERSREPGSPADSGTICRRKPGILLTGSVFDDTMHTIRDPAPAFREHL